MRICLLQSSYDDMPDAPYKDYDTFPDPGTYIAPEHHTFEHRIIRVPTGDQDIDKAIEEKFDVYCNWMWGGNLGPVSGVAEYERLAKSGVLTLIILPPLSQLDKTTLNALALTSGTINIPGNKPGKFPKIVKYADSCSSHNLHEIYHDEQAVDSRIKWMKEQEPQRQVLTQDYIVGDECSCIVIELGSDNAMSLTPLEYLFSPGTSENEAFLSFERKFDGVAKGEIRYGFVTDEPRRSIVQKAAIEAFKIARQGQPGCWARCDLRYERSTKTAYVLEIGSPPVVFYPVNNTLGDDLVVKKTFPGGQAAIFDLILFSRHLQLGQNSPLTMINTQEKQIATTYDKFTERLGATYDEVSAVRFSTVLHSFIESSKFPAGTFLDLGCGTGLVGKILNELGRTDSITGVDISTGMTDCETIRKYYQNPVITEPIQTYVMKDIAFDNVVCFGTAHFLHPIVFNAWLARNFIIARKTVSFALDDHLQSTIDNVLEAHKLRLWNLSEVMDRFGTPPGWSKVRDERVELYVSPTSGDVVHSRFLLFARDETWVPKVPQIDQKTQLFSDS